MFQDKKQNIKEVDYEHLLEILNQQKFDPEAYNLLIEMMNQEIDLFY